MEKEEALKAERQKIDAIDAQITQLLEERMEAVAQIALIKGEAKQAVTDEAREEKVLAQVADKVKNPAYEESIKDTFKDIMKHSRAYQKRQISGGQ